jgi:hypothetical protein
MTDHPPAMHVCSYCLARVTELTSTTDFLCSRCFSLLYPKADQLWEGDDLPRKPSLKEQALIVLDDASLDAAHENILRRALEALPND